jgi:hypothetical protein
VCLSFFCFSKIVLFAARTCEVSALLGAHLHCPFSPAQGQMRDSHQVIPDLFSVVEQEQGEKAGQDSEQRAEKSEPNRDLPP